jgi:hypothetical protein
MRPPVNGEFDPVRNVRPEARRAKTGNGKGRTLEVWAKGLEFVESLELVVMLMVCIEIEGNRFSYENFR